MVKCIATNSKVGMFPFVWLLLFLRGHCTGSDAYFTQRENLNSRSGMLRFFCDSQTTKQMIVVLTF